MLIIADTVRSPELRHEVPLPVPDPFLYAEAAGKRYVGAHSMEVVRLAELDGLEALPLERFGYDELLREGRTRVEASREVQLRACRELGITSAAVPPTFPLEAADHMRTNVIDLRSDRELFATRRRA